jgi:long-chain fatty acid transport protein
MTRCSVTRIAAFCSFALLSLPSAALAGGNEYAADGTRGLGRGGAIMARADDPRIMVRNPALLADMWGSSLYLSTNYNYPDACFRPSGGYGWGEENEILVLDPDAGPILSTAREGWVGGTDPDKLEPLEGYLYEPYPEICYQGGVQITPSVGLTTKWGENLGVGIGFMPPELATADQMGNRNGTIETRNGLRPNPMRFMDSHRNATYFGLLGAIGYRVAPWLRLGLGLRWSVVMANATAWNRYNGPRLSPRNDILIEMHGHDAFVPGFTASIHVVPFDALDLAVGFRWEDYVRFKSVKLDMTTDPWGLGGPFYYSESEGGDLETINTVPPYTNVNVPGELRVPPVSVPQLSAAIRFADRVKPRPEKYTGLQKGSDPMRDPMADERWDIEFDWIYYFSSFNDNQDFYFSGDQRIGRAEIDEAGQVKERPTMGPVTACPVDLIDGVCPEMLVTPDKIGGVDQMTMRLGGDYNVILNVLALRAGVSYEQRGIEVGFARPNYGLPYERLGIHGGFTWRIDGRTDFSFGYAHYFQETIELSINDSENGGIDRFLDEARTFYEPAKKKTEGLNEEEAEAAVKEMYNVIDPDDADGTAEWRSADNQFFVNAGTHKFNLDVWGVSITRHF